MKESSAAHIHLSDSNLRSRITRSRRDRRLRRVEAAADGSDLRFASFVCAHQSRYTRGSARTAWSVVSLPRTTGAGNAEVLAPL